MSNSIPTPTPARIRGAWEDATDTAKQADIGHMVSLSQILMRAIRVNQELCCTPLRHRLDDELVGAYNVIREYLSMLEKRT